MATKVLSSIIGKFITEVEVADRQDEVTIRCADGSTFRMFHYWDCTEEVSIEHVTGDWSDLIGHPILVAEERTSDVKSDESGIEMWTFYCFRTIKGSVDIRWFGSSNGHYGVEVNFEKIA